MERALIIAYNDLNNSGVPCVIYQTIKALHKNHSFDVLVFDDDDYYYKKLLNEGISINLIKYTEKKPNSKFKKFFWLVYFRLNNYYLFMKKLNKSNSYSVVHSFKERDSWPFFKAAKQAGIKKRIFHCNVIYKSGKKTFYDILAFKNRLQSIRYSSVLVGVSELCSKNAFGKRAHKVIYNSYDDSKYNYCVSNSLKANELVITQVAAFNENKNQLFSLKVLQELLKLYPNTRLNLVGASEPNSYYNSLINYVNTNNLTSNVSIVAKTDKVEKIYEKTTFVIVPSFKEGFSLVAIEAQACGISVFASSNITEEIDCGGVRYFDLSEGAAYWAKEIYKLFLEQNNSRSVFNVDRFAFTTFKKELKSFYILD